MAENYITTAEPLLFELNDLNLFSDFTYYLSILMKS